MVIIFRDGKPIELTEDEVFDCYRAYRTMQDYAALKKQCMTDRQLVGHMEDELIYTALKALDTHYHDGTPSDIEEALFNAMIDVVLADIKRKEAAKK